MEPSTLGARVETKLVVRHFTDGITDPFDTVEWVTRDAWPNEPKYHNPGIEVPTTWSQNALDIVSKLYLAKAADYTEKSIGKLIQRVASKYAIEFFLNGYTDARHVNITNDMSHTTARVDWLTLLRSDDPVKVFYDELCYILLHQLAAFNSPVWFNVGRADRPQQVSACFILSVDDNTTSIMETARREAFIFKGGSGSGFDVSRIRGSAEPLSTGGTASGPVSFMRLWDAGAGTFKSGGTTRRAAKLVKCDVDHPDIREFIQCKAREEDRLRILAEAGMDIGFSEQAERDIAEVTAFQNANNSVGVTDDFMRKATDGDSTWTLQPRVMDAPLDRQIMPMIDDAQELLDLIAEAAWKCADPGMLFMDTINRMHTTPRLDGKDSPIRSSNPCGEFLSNDDTSCNLASTNVLKFLRDPDHFDVAGYRQVVDVMILAMDVGICFADFPDEALADRTRKLRQLGLGYSNMGAAIMAQGMPYDSDEARKFAASVTALNTGRAYYQSAKIAQVKGPFHYFDENRSAMLAVIGRHRGALPDLDYGTIGSEEVWKAADADWTNAVAVGVMHGFRNAQASVLAPAGSISYLMDCDTTGIEPAFTLVSYKELAGGGSMVLVNSSVERGARALGGYSEDNLKQLAQGDTSCISSEDLPTFHGANEISWQGHIKMLAAVQPFVSGGISKTINMPEEATVEDVREAYVTAWKLGVKDLALYRNNSKVRQVLAAKPKTKPEPVLMNEDDDLVVKLMVNQELKERAEVTAAKPSRRRMPRTRRMVGHKIHVRSVMGEHEGYVMAGVQSDGSLGEVFIEGFGKQGSFTQNALAAWATDFSIALQYGVPMEVLCRKHAYVSDETGGVVVPDAEGTPLVLRECKSIVDYIARWLVAEFGDTDLAAELGVMTDAVKARKTAELDAHVATPTSDVVNVKVKLRNGWSDTMTNGHGHAVEMGPPCSQCGGTMHRAGACWQCRCGNSTGCG